MIERNRCMMLLLQAGFNAKMVEVVRLHQPNQVRTLNM